MPVTSSVDHETDEKYFGEGDEEFEFGCLKLMLMKTI